MLFDIVINFRWNLTRICNNQRQQYDILLKRWKLGEGTFLFYDSCWDDINFMYHEVFCHPISRAKILLYICHKGIHLCYKVVV